MAPSRLYVRRFIFALLVASMAAVPSFTFAAGFFGPIVPASCHCPNQPINGGSGTVTTAPDYGCVLMVIQNLINIAISLGIVLCVIWIAYAGFMLVASAGNPQRISSAKSRIVGALVGIVVILCSWLLVNFVMGVLYNGKFGDWNGILAGDGNDTCIQANQPHALTVGSVVTSIIGTATTQTPGTYSTGTGTGSCDAQTVASAAAAGGYQLTAAQANALACIAKPESSCGTNTGTATTPSGNTSSAAGPWQNLLGASDKCHSLDIPACGNLNCSAAYSGGRVKSDPASQQLAAQCQAAVNNLTCGAAAAACLIQANNGSFSAWAADSRSSVQKTCITSNGLTY